MKDLPKPNKPLTVLVVEDESRLRDVLLRAIPDMGFICRAARSGEDALQLMAQQRFEIVVVDLNLPGMSGLDVLEKVHELSPDTCGLVLTGFGDLNAAQTAIRLEVVDFLTKPASLGEIERALDRARQRYWRHRPALPTLEELEAPEDEPGQEPRELSDRQSTLADLEREHILSVLDRNKGNRASTAAELGISVRTLYYRLAQFQRKGHPPIK